MNQQFRFYFKESQSPTTYNLRRYLQAQGWNATRFCWRAHFSDENLKFDQEAAQQLEYKHLLAQLVAKYCPEVMPLSYCINDENWPQVLNRLAANYYSANDKMDNLTWILKPALLNNGKEIKIFQTLSELEQHFLSAQRLGGEHILQRYLSNPHLLRDKRKYSIRMFLVITNYAGSFLYPYGYYNVALFPYEATNFKDLRPHLTNEHLQEEEANVLQIPSERFEQFSAVYSQVKSILLSLLKGFKQQNSQVFNCINTRRLAIYGIDFMLENTGRLWLLEANHGPCFPVTDDHPLQSYLYYDFWQNFIASFVLPIAKQQPATKIQYHGFESLENNNNFTETVLK